MQQKVQFIGAVLHDPRLIIMDEPFTGLDPANAVVLKDVLLEMSKSGKTFCSRLIAWIKSNGCANRSA